MGCDLAGKPDSDRVLILWGDSFARALSPALATYSRDSGAGVRQQARKEIEKAIEDRSGVRFAELFDPLCPGVRCSAGTIEEPPLSDKVHLSTIAAQRLVLPILRPYLAWLFGVDAPPLSRRGSD